MSKSIHLTLCNHHLVFFLRPFLIPPWDAPHPLLHHSALRRWIWMNTLWRNLFKSDTTTITIITDAIIVGTETRNRDLWTGRPLDNTKLQVLHFHKIPVKYNSKLAAWGEEAQCFICGSLWRYLVALVELILNPDGIGLCWGSVKCRSRAWCESVRQQLASIRQIKGTDRHADPWPDNLWLPLSRPIENREEKFRQSGFWLEPVEECENPEERETGRDGSATAGLNSSRNPVDLFYFSLNFLKKKKEKKNQEGVKKSWPFLKFGTNNYTWI